MTANEQEHLAFNYFERAGWAKQAKHYDSFIGQTTKQAVGGLCSLLQGVVGLNDRCSFFGSMRADRLSDGLPRCKRTRFDQFVRRSFEILARRRSARLEVVDHVLQELGVLAQGHDLGRWRAGSRHAVRCDIPGRQVGDG